MSRPAEIAERTLPVLRERFPDARYELDWETPLDLLVATILAAQCTDERVNRVTKTLFPKYPTARDYAEVEITELEEDVKPTGFYKNKAKTVQAVAKMLVEKFDGEVPRTMAELVTLPGVARKTANVVLTTAFNLAEGVIVDTHVLRVSQRLGLSASSDASVIEADLMKLLPREVWTFWGPAMVLHGRYVCTAKKPACDECAMAAFCPKIGV
jgi:endonuclease III